MSATDFNIVSRWQVESSSTAGRFYIVSELTDGTFACGCVGWTRHMPRRDCVHIRWVREHGPEPLNSLVVAIERAQRKVVVA